MNKKHGLAVSIIGLSLVASACVPAPQNLQQPATAPPPTVEESPTDPPSSSSPGETPAPTESESLEPDAGHGPDDDQTSDTLDDDRDLKLGTPVTSTNMVYTITPVGDWTAIHNTEGGGRVTQPNDPDENIELQHSNPDASGIIILGSNFDGSGLHDESDVWVQEELSAVNVPAFDTPTGPGYITEQIIGRSDSNGDNYFYAAQLVTVAEDEDPFLASTHRPEGINGVMIAITYTPDGTGGETLNEVKKFLKSDIRKDTVAMLRHIEVNR